MIGKGSFGKVLLVRKKPRPAAATAAASGAASGTSGTGRSTGGGSGDGQQLYAMKILSKASVVKRKQVEHTRAERRILGCTRHPFIIALHYAFQSRDKLFLVVDYAAGGELFFHLGRLGRFKEPMAA